MNINYRQILVIVTVLLLFELMSIGVKKCSKDDNTLVDRANNYKSIFPLPLNDSTKSLLIGDWKYEETTLNNQLIVELAKFTKDSVVIDIHHHNLTRTINVYNGKWSNEMNAIKIETTFYTFGKVYFYNEDEFISGGDRRLKWIRISETKHPHLYDNSK